MIKLKLGHIYLALLTLMYSVSSLAATTKYRDIFQYNNGALYELTDKVFERDIFDNINAGFRLLNTIDLYGQYTVQVGSTWTWQLYKKTNEYDQPVNNLIREYTLTYQGEVGDCPNKWSTGGLCYSICLGFEMAFILYRGRSL